jgi:magnesium transporter
MTGGQDMNDSANDARARLSASYAAAFPDEVARTLETADALEAADYLNTLPAGTARAVVERLSPTMGAACLAAMGDHATRQLLESMDPVRAAALVGQLTTDLREANLALVNDALAAELREILTFMPDTAGHFMDTRVVTFTPEYTAAQALKRLQDLRRTRASNLIVVDRDGLLVGLVPLAEVVFADPDVTLATLLTREAPQVNVMAPRDEVVEILTRTGVTLLPVVDLDNHLLGAIRHDAMIQAIREEATAGMQTMVGVSKDERALSSPILAVKKRLPWLNINLLTAFLAAAVVGLFEDTIAKFTALAVLLPVVAGQSGNTGAQALAVTMRGLALREIRTRHWPRVVGKEATAGFLNGIAIAVVTALGVLVWSRSLGLTVVIGVAMVMSMVIAGVSGAAIPLILSALRQDPAQSGSIILTTVTDVMGFLSFLGLATLFSRFL